MWCGVEAEGWVRYAAHPQISSEICSLQSTISAKVSKTKMMMIYSFNSRQKKDGERKDVMWLNGWVRSRLLSNGNTYQIKNIVKYWVAGWYECSGPLDGSHILILSNFWSYCYFALGPNLSACFCLSPTCCFLLILILERRNVSETIYSLWFYFICLISWINTLDLMFLYYRLYHVKILRIIIYLCKHMKLYFYFYFSVINKYANILLYRSHLVFSFLTLASVQTHYGFNPVLC